MEKAVRLLLAAASIGAAAPAARASMIEVMIQPVAHDDDPALWDVEIYTRCDTGRPGRTDGGIRALQVDILSAGTGLAAPVIGTGGNLAGPHALITWSDTVRANFNRVDPIYVDCPTSYHAIDTDTDPDAMGAMFFDLNNFLLTDFGTHGVWEYVGTEQWRLTSPGTPERLDVYIVAPQYFDFVDGRPQSYGINFTDLRGYGTSIGQQIGLDTLVVPVWLPEPGAMSLIPLALPLLARRRRPGPPLTPAVS